jgi:hypothetical protein
MEPLTRSFSLSSVVAARNKMAANPNHAKNWEVDMLSVWCVRAPPCAWCSVCSVCARGGMNA